MIEGQPFNGLYGCHWDCVEVVREREGVMKGDPAIRSIRQSNNEQDRLLKQIRGGIEQMEKDNEALKAENAALKATLKRTNDHLLDVHRACGGCDATHAIMASGAARLLISIAHENASTKTVVTMEGASWKDEEIGDWVVTAEKATATT